MIVTNKMDKSIIEKIQKLLQLANSPNESEARSATNKANELLIKYNLSLQSIIDHESEYEKQELVTSGLTLKPHQSMITTLLQEYFFVKVIIGSDFVGHSSGKWGNQRAQYRKVISLVGTEENCRIATYIFAYLNDVYPKLWKDYFDRNSRVEGRDKRSYYSGLTSGISKMLKQTKWRVENETGLVVIDDPGLVKAVEKITTGTYGGTSNANINREVERDGLRDGQKISLRKPIASETTDKDSRKLLK